MYKHIPALTFLIVLSVVLTACTNNIYSEFSNPNSDEALLYKAQQALDEQNFAEAISIINNDMSTSGRAKTEARELLSHAYAGKCGLVFYDYITNFSSATSGSAFKIAATPFVGSDVDPDSCLLSLQTMDLIGTSSERTADQNLFSAIVGMALMGGATRSYTDASPTYGDGSEDSAGISCTLSDAQMNNIILGYTYLSLNYAAVSSQLGSSASTVSGTISICSTLGGGSSCTDTNPSNISTTMRDLMKDLLNTTTYGVGTVDGSNPVNIPTACP